MLSDGLLEPIYTDDREDIDELGDRYEYAGDDPDDGTPMWRLRPDEDAAYDEYCALRDSGVYRGT